MFHYQNCGLKNVYLANGFTEYQTPYGKGYSIDNLQGLHQTIGLSLCIKPDVLNEDEIRFLRKEMELSQRGLAELLDVKEITVRKWESGQNKIAGPADKLLRLLYKSRIEGPIEVQESMRLLAELDRSDHEIRLQFKETNEKWLKDCAA